MKTFYFNIQAKGGSGKSMLTYLQALKNETNNRAYFIDLDSSVRREAQVLKVLILYIIEICNYYHGNINYHWQQSPFYTQIKVGIASRPTL